MFPLLRYFSIASFVSIVVTTIFLGALHHQVERNQLLELGESNHVALTQTVGNALLPALRGLVLAAKDLDDNALRALPDLATLKPKVLDAMRNTRAVKIKMYEISGRTLFSTDPAQIGKDYRDNPGFISAVAGHPMSELTHRDRFSAFDQEIVDRDVLSSYVALRPSKDAPVEGVLEVYSDVTDWVAKTNHQARVMTLGTVIPLCLLYAVLYVIVRRADKIMRNQYEQQKKAENELRIAATAFDNQQGMVVTNAEGVILRVNPAFTEATGHTPEEAIGQTLRLLKSGRHDDAFYADIWAKIRTLGHWEGEIWNRRKNGEIYPDWLTINAVRTGDGEISNYVTTLTDITQRKAAEEEIKFLAFYDPLTQLPNRRLLQDRLDHALGTAARSKRHGALMFVDLDNFKDINDTLGHDTGDILLQQVAMRLSAIVRECDTVARWGGDEFIVMLENLDEDAGKALIQLRGVTDKILVALNESYLLGERTCINTPSIGATLFNGRASNAGELLKQADAAMYRAKAAGRNQATLFAVEVEPGN
jgi:diguanylate cyclase (GGDEF)-like protein/PAS domain S-box-containing protein